MVSSKVFRGATPVSRIVFNRPTFRIVPLATTLLLPSLGWAQSEVEEIVVTASKRGASTAQDMSSSIKAFGQETLEAMGVDEITDFSRSVPGLDVVDAGPGQKRYLIRGLNLPGESTVGVYYDNIAMSGMGDDAATSGGNQVGLDMFDMERVEVLRGPQGTLYGANSVSGTLRIITNKPDSSSLTGKVSASAAGKTDGDPNWDVKGMVNIPLIENTLAVRGVAYISEIGGFIDNIQLQKGEDCYGVQAPNPEIVLLDIPGCNDGTSNREDVNSHRREGGRVALQWDVAPATTLLLQGFYQTIESEGRDNAAHPVAAANPGPPFIASVRGGSNIIFTPAAGERRSNVRGEEPYDEELYIAALELEHDFEWATGTFATSYLDRSAINRLDSSNPARLHRSFAAAGTPPPINGAVISPTDRVSLWQDQGTELFNLEARLASQFDRPYNFLVGLFYQDKTRDVDSQGRIADPNTGADLTTAEVRSLLSPEELTRLDSFPWPTDPVLITRRVAEDTTESLAVYGEVYYELGDKIELMGGMRYFDIERTQSSNIIVPFLNSIPLQGAPPGPADILPAKEDDFLFKGQITYRPTDDHQVYFQVAEGFRSGGVNPQLVAAIPPSFDSDQTLNLEAGIKTRWLDNRLTANLAVYTIEWSDIQFEADFTNQFAGLLNCTMADDPVRADGVEVALQALLYENLDVGVDFTVLDAEWQVDANNCISPELLATTLDGELFQMAGDKLVGVPDYSGSAYAQYNYPSPPFGALGAFIRADIQFQGEVDRNEAVLAQNLSNPSYVLANINAGMDFSDFSVQLSVRNVTDEEARLSMFQGFQTDNRVAAVQPRTVGINVTYNFGDL